MFVNGMKHYFVFKFETMISNTWFAKINNGFVLSYLTCIQFLISCRTTIQMEIFSHENRIFCLVREYCNPNYQIKIDD